MKSFIIASILIGCLVSFGHAEFGVDGWATGYGSVYIDLWDDLERLQLKIPDWTIRAAQAIHDDVQQLFTSMKERDGGQVPIIVSKLEDDLLVLASKLITTNQLLRELLLNVASKIVELKSDPDIKPLKYLKTLNQLIKDFDKKLKLILGEG